MMTQKENRKSLSLLGLLLTGLLALTSCTDNDDNKGERPSPIPESPLDDNDKIKREPKTVTVSRGGTDQGTVELWFYEDMPNVPYISVSAFQELMLPGTTVKVEMTSTGELTLTGPTAKATVSTTAETFTSDDYMSFTNLMGLVRTGMANVYLDGAPYIRYNGMNLTPPSATVSSGVVKVSGTPLAVWQLTSWSPRKSVTPVTSLVASLCCVAMMSSESR